MFLILAIIVILMLCMLAYSNMQQRALIALTKANDVKTLADMQATLKEYEVGDDYFEKVRRANREEEGGETYEDEAEVSRVVFSCHSCAQLAVLTPNPTIHCRKPHRCRPAIPSSCPP